MSLTLLKKQENLNFIGFGDNIRTADSTDYADCADEKSGKSVKSATISGSNP